MTNSTACNLLVSARSLDESNLLRQLMVPWIDLKEPRHGPLGRPLLDNVERFAAMHQDGSSALRWSIAGGELYDWNIHHDSPFIAALNTQGHIKWGLANCKGLQGWERKLEQLIEQLPTPHQGILVHYADADLVQGPTWKSLLHRANESGVNKVLIDTAIKDGRTLKDYISLTELKEKILQSQEAGLQIAIAGSIPLGDLKSYSELNPNWIGLRGSVCSNPLQRTSSIDSKLVVEALGCLADRDFYVDVG